MYEQLRAHAKAASQNLQGWAPAPTIAWGEERHQPRFTPKALIKATVRGIRNTDHIEAAEVLPEEQHPQIVAAMLASHCTIPVPAHKAVATQIRAQELEKKVANSTVMFRFADGSTAIKPKCTDTYVDEYM